jgi:hypothetical protein
VQAPGQEDLIVEKEKQSGSPDAEKDPGFRNIFKWIILIAVLAGAWFLLDWLINGK